jgi:F420-dependent oxidoreductase-like protein
VRLGLSLGFAPPGTNPTELVALAQEAERLGYESAWAAEAWGSDAVTVLAWVAATTTRLRVGSAIMQIPARTPACTAMTAATLDLMSGGRFVLGLGVSGPQVVEGWHGQPWGKPLAKTREYVEIVRAALRREEVEHDSQHYQLPYRGPGSSGLGKPLRLMARPRPDIPIYLAALGPRNVELAAEIADGWLPLFLSPDRFDDVFLPHLAQARRERPLEVAASVQIVLGDDVQSCRDAVKPTLALYLGGMGAPGQNFYNKLACRYGYDREAREIQELYLGGRRRDAVAAVPDALVDEVALVGPRERIAERLETWRTCGVTTLLCQTRDVETLRTMAALVA